MTMPPQKSILRREVASEFHQYPSALTTTQPKVTYYLWNFLAINHSEQRDYYFVKIFERTSHSNSKRGGRSQ
jgi:hypothetical protein